MEGLSFSNTLSKGSVYESDSIYGAYLEDAVSRLADGVRPEAISNEEIHKDDLLLETYRVEDDAIHGGMGSVWRVYHDGWRADLAMKRPQPRFFSEGSERRKQEFIAECEHWIDLGLHSNIVSCYYVREIGGVPTIFSEWMNGGSLKDAIQSGRLYGAIESWVNGRRVDKDTDAEVKARILDIAIQTARGLRYSHRKGLIHQDVKPGNILLKSGSLDFWGNLEVKVADFGLAKAQSQLLEGSGPRSTGCTPEYCPREQAEGAAAEAWMDAYAWALTVLEMYAGKRLWRSGAEAAELFRDKNDLTATLRVEPPRALLQALEACVLEHRDDFSALEALMVQCYRETTHRPYPRPDVDGDEEAAAALNNRALSFLDLGRREDALALLEQARGEVAAYNRALIRRRTGASTEELDKRLRSKLKCLINLENRDVRNAWTELTEPVFDADEDHLLNDSDLGFNYELIKTRLTQPSQPQIREFVGTAGCLFDGKLLLGVSSGQKPGKLPPENPESMKLMLVDIETGRTLMDFALPPLYPYGRPFSHVGKVSMSRGGKYAFAINMNMQPDTRGRSFRTPMERERYLSGQPCFESDVWNRAMGVHVWDGRTGAYLKYLGIGAVGYEGLQGLWADPENEEIVRVGEYEWNVQTEACTRHKVRDAAREYTLPGGYAATVTRRGDASHVELRRNDVIVSRYGGGQISVDTERGVIMDAPYPVSHDKYRSLWNYEHRVTLLTVRDFDFRAPLILEKLYTTDELIKEYERAQTAEDDARKAAAFLDGGDFRTALRLYRNARDVCDQKDLWEKPLGRMCMELGWRFGGRAVPTFARAVAAGRVDGPFKNHVSLAYDSEVEVGDDAYKLISDPRHRETIPIMPMDEPYSPIAFRLSVRSLSTGQTRTFALPEGVVHAAILTDGELYCLIETTVMREVAGSANQISDAASSNDVPFLLGKKPDGEATMDMPGDETIHVRWPMASYATLYRVSLKDGIAVKAGPGAVREHVIALGSKTKPVVEVARRVKKDPQEFIGVSDDARLLVCGCRCDSARLFLLNCYWVEAKGDALPELVSVNPDLDWKSSCALKVRNLGYKKLTVIEPEEPEKAEPKPEPAKPKQEPTKPEAKPEPPKPKTEPVKPDPCEKPPKKGFFARLFGRRKDR